MLRALRLHIGRQRGGESSTVGAMSDDGDHAFRIGQEADVLRTERARARMVVVDDNIAVRDRAARQAGNR